MTGAGGAGLRERTMGPVTVLFGERDGRYPQGNSVLVRGARESVLIDPSLGLVPRRRALPGVDRILLSHCHEDHIAGIHLFPGVPVHLHEQDLPGIRSLDGLLAIYGFAGAFEDTWRRVLVEQFHFEPRPDAAAFRDGEVFDLGGGVTIETIHTPGHTRGHTAFRIRPGDHLYLGDIDLSSFGPYYGDAWSDLEAFERTLARLPSLAAGSWITFHHIGVLDDAAAFRERYERFAGAIARREERLLAFLEAPRTLAEIARHRILYRPGDDVAWADIAERRTAEQHLARLVAAGRVRGDGERFVAATAAA